MASVNKVFVLGTLGRDPEIRSGKNAIANLSIATNRKYKAADGTLAEETEWHRVTLFGRLAEIAEKYLHKGDSAFVEGRLRTRVYTDKQGVERRATEIVGESLQLLPRGGSRGGAAESSDGTLSGGLSEEDIPF